MSIEVIITRVATARTTVGVAALGEKDLLLHWTTRRSCVQPAVPLITLTAMKQDWYLYRRWNPRTCLGKSKAIPFLVNVSRCQYWKSVKIYAGMIRVIKVSVNDRNGSLKATTY